MSLLFIYAYVCVCVFVGASTAIDVGVSVTANRHVFQHGFAAAGKCDLANHKENECKSNRIS